MNSIVVIHTGGLGDFLQILPVLGALRAKWPEARITIAGRPDRAVLAREGGLVHCVTDFETSGLHRLFAPDAASGDVPPVLRCCDAILNFLPHEAFSANLSRLTGARVLHAVSFPAPRTCAVPAAQFVYDQVASQLVLPACEAIPRLRLPGEHPALRAMAQRFPEAGRSVAIHPGSGSPRKNWPLARFEELAAALANEGTEAIWLLGPVEVEAPEFGAASHNASCLADAPLVDVAGLLSLVRGFVGNDSGVTHLAAALGTPTAALFGPSDGAVWAPRGPNVRVLAAEGAALSRLAPDEVRRALGELLDPCRARLRRAP